VSAGSTNSLLTFAGDRVCQLADLEYNPAYLTVEMNPSPVKRIRICFPMIFSRFAMGSPDPRMQTHCHRSGACGMWRSFGRSLVGFTQAPRFERI
jgi:hypothetical protein